MNLTPRKLAVALYALVVLGAALVVAGVAMEVSVPAAVIVAGLYLMGGALLALRVDV